MILGDIVTLCQSWLDDPQGGYFSRTVLLPWINNAQMEVQKLLIAAGENFYLQCKETTTVANQALYLLPDDFLKLHRLELIISGTFPNETKSTITPITLNEQDLIDPSPGDPTYYVIKKNALQLFPTPDTAKTLRLNYSYRVADMTTDNQTPDVPAQYHEYIAVLATLDGALKDQRDMSGLIAKRTYYEQMLKDDADQRNVDQPRSIVTTENDPIRVF